jgi:hypothetical protein
MEITSSSVLLQSEPLLMLPESQTDRTDSGQPTPQILPTGPYLVRVADRRDGRRAICGGIQMGGFGVKRSRLGCDWAKRDRLAGGRLVLDWGTTGLVQLGGDVVQLRSEQSCGPAVAPFDAILVDESAGDRGQLRQVYALPA